MQINKSKIFEKLKVLVSGFARQLTERTDTLIDAWEEYKNNQNKNLSAQNFRFQVHKLAGSSATFGFSHVAEILRDIESMFSTIIEEERQFQDAEVEYIEDLMSKLAVLVNKHDISFALKELGDENGGSSHPVNDNEEPRVVYLVGDENIMQPELSSQLNIYGFSAQTVDSVDLLMNELQQGNKLLLIIHTDFLEHSRIGGKKFSELKSSYPGLLSIIFVAEEDNFNTRLMAVRNGADAFFLLPVDVGRLIDRIEDLMTEQEPDPYNILIVDDDPEQVAYYAYVLQQAGMLTSVASDPAQVIKILIETKPELILMDMYMPACNGMELAAVIRQQEAFVSIPIVFLSIERNPETQLRAIAQGADEFLTKPIKPETLVESVMVRAERTRNIRFFMERDSLTGLLNHTHLKEQIAREINRVKRSNGKLSFVMLDIDYFKNVNDTYGHLAGDRVLKTLSRLLTERLRQTDVIGRYGGEEFGIILLNADLQDAYFIMENLRKSFSQVTHHAEGEEFTVTFSCGIASYPEYIDPGLISEVADKALYLSKEHGRNRVTTADELF
ncbi:MAG: diguanylate cyclase [Spirochaetia bacterium]